jgi:hypothetical protein
MKAVIKIISLIQGGTTAFDGEYVVEYDPGRDGVEPGTGFPMFAHLVTVRDQRQATRFEPDEAIELWRSVDPRQPVRDDGQPNRPMTAFTVEIEAVDE